MDRAGRIDTTETATRTSDLTRDRWMIVAERARGRGGLDAWNYWVEDSRALSAAIADGRVATVTGRDADQRLVLYGKIAKT